ncbi:hypothetical protein [Streptomyces sp. NPDC052192]|uniref:hypothetical protein n=1 Tax=Streptomyces sp. NPDC052192 TaxID=3155052 RepID=UPI00341F0AD2
MGGRVGVERTYDTKGNLYAPPGRRSEPPQLDFPPVRNGIDYLASVAQHLDLDVPP